MLAPYRKIGGFGKMLAPYRKIGGFEKYWRLAEIQADDRILAGVEIPAPGEISADLKKVGGPLTVQARQNLELLTSSWTG